MLNIVPVSFPGMKHIEDNIDLYVDKFLAGEIIAFRGANCTLAEQEHLAKILGDKLGWWPNSEPNEDPFYVETHEDSMSKNPNAGFDSLLLSWHQEHVGSSGGTYVGAIWCMNLYKCDPRAGKTYFVDLVNLFKSLPEDDRIFLDKSFVRLVAVDPSEPPREDYKIIQHHWASEEKVPRCVLSGSHGTELISIDGRAPSEEEKSRFKFLFDGIVDAVNNNEDIRFVQSWEEGDLLIFDVFRWAHAVTGGFKLGERKLDGIFGMLY